MARARSLAILGLGLALILPLTTRAAERQCDFQPDIIALSDYVLKNRAGLARFKSLRYGAISAYLKIRYGKPSAKEVETMLMPMVQARVARADELMFAWAINTYGIDAAIAIVGPKTADLLLTQGYSASVLRAAIVKEGIDGFDRQVKNVPPEARFKVEIRVPPALLDKFDTYKAEIGRQAEAKGYFQIAAGLAATQDDVKAWSDLAARMSDKDLLRQALGFWYWVPALVGNPALERSGLDPQWRKNRDQIHNIMIASAMMPERDFLSTYANQTGNLDEAAKVAETVVTVASDKTGEAWTMDRAWITAYLELLSVAADGADADRQLKAIPFSGLRHYDGSVRDVLDWMIAADALAPYLTKKSSDKSLPGLISKDFAVGWPAWQAAADAIRSGLDLSSYQDAPEREAIAAELLFASGGFHRLAAFITGATPDDMSVNLAEDFANRMDRICYGYLNFPAEGITFPDTPMFRFD